MGLNNKALIIKVTKKREHKMEKSSLNFARLKTIIIFAAHFNTSIEKSIKWRDGLLSFKLARVFFDLLRQEL